MVTKAEVETKLQTLLGFDNPPNIQLQSHLLIAGLLASLLPDNITKEDIESSLQTLFNYSSPPDIQKQTHLLVPGLLAYLIDNS